DSRNSMPSPHPAERDRRGHRVSAVRARVGRHGHRPADRRRMGRGELLEHLRRRARARGAVVPRAARQGRWLQSDRRIDPKGTMPASRATSRTPPPARKKPVRAGARAGATKDREAGGNGMMASMREEVAAYRKDLIVRAASDAFFE